jgi:hypothetical protein
MSKVEQIQAELRSLSPADLRRVRDWLDNFVEDRLEFREDFEAAIRESDFIAPAAATETVVAPDQTTVLTRFRASLIPLPLTMRLRTVLLNMVHDQTKDFKYAAP